MIYGYVWPKTDRAGPHDKEERVMDHRTIHRFLDPNNERIVRGRKPLREETEDTEEPEESPRGRLTKRGSVKNLTAKQQMLKKKRAEEAAEEAEDLDGVRRSGRARRISSRLL